MNGYMRSSHISHLRSWYFLPECFVFCCHHKFSVILELDHALLFLFFPKDSLASLQKETRRFIPLSFWCILELKCRPSIPWDQHHGSRSPCRGRHVLLSLDCSFIFFSEVQFLQLLFIPFGLLWIFSQRLLQKKKKCFIFKNNFRFTAKLSIRCRDFQYTSCSCTCIASYQYPH